MNNVREENARLQRELASSEARIASEVRNGAKLEETGTRAGIDVFSRKETEKR